MAKGGFKGPKSNAAMIATGIAIVVLIFIVYASFFMVPASSDHRVLLVASEVILGAGGPAKFASFLSNQSVAVVPYNYDSVATYAELGDLVKAHMASTGATRVRSVGIMYHTPNTYNLKCFKSDPEKSTGSGSLESFELFRRFVVALRAAYGVEDVDLISCAVVSAERNVLSALDFNGARVNASTNTTGQAKQGPVGDWVLEAGDVNLIGRYFNASITQADLALDTYWGDGGFSAGGFFNSMANGFTSRPQQAPSTFSNVSPSYATPPPIRNNVASDPKTFESYNRALAISGAKVAPAVTVRPTTHPIVAVVAANMAAMSATRAPNSQCKNKCCLSGDTSVSGPSDLVYKNHLGIALTKPVCGCKQPGSANLTYAYDGATEPKRQLRACFRA
jgi:hypothetical protein